MRGEITVRILEILQEGAIGTADLFAVLVSAPYGTSLGTFEYELQKRKKGRIKEEVHRMKRQNFYNLIYKLKRDQLLEDTSRNRKMVLLITSQGKGKLKKLRWRLQRKKLLDSYVPEQSERLTIVIFDIPEKQRGARDWLREALRNIGLRMIQKSVWIGNVKVPKEFLDHLRWFDILEYVEIFEISKMGSLRHLA